MDFTSLTEFFDGIINPINIGTYTKAGYILMIFLLGSVSIMTFRMIYFILPITSMIFISYIFNLTANEGLLVFPVTVCLSIYYAFRVVKKADSDVNA